MQTFLPYADFEKTARCLWYRHLGKQRVECQQIFNALFRGGGWSNHPATRMWRGHAYYLWLYYTAVAFEWVRRGYKHHMRLDDEIVVLAQTQQTKPPWLGSVEIHHAYKIRLLYKKPEHYAQAFANDFPGLSHGTMPIYQDYVWPV